MFKIGKKSLIRRALFVMVGFLVTSIGVFTVIKNTNKSADAETPNGATVTITYLDNIPYGDPGSPYGNGSGMTHKFGISTPAGSFEGVCAQAALSAPANGASLGSRVATGLTNHDRVKLLLYMFYNPSGPNTNPNSNQNVINGMFQTISDSRTRFAYIHSVVSYLVTGASNDLPPTQAQWAVNVADQLQRMISNNSANWIAARDYYTLYQTNPQNSSQQIVVWVEGAEPSLGSITVYKRDGLGGCPDAFKNRITFSIAGVGTQTVDGNCNVTFTGLVQGRTYTIWEDNVPYGYDTAASQNITLNGTSASATFVNRRNRGSIKVQKRDSQSGTTPQGNANFNGITFSLTGNGVSKSCTLSSGNTSCTFDDLLFGTYTLTESIGTNTTYIISVNSSKTQAVSESNPDVTVNFDNTVKKGQITVNKTDSKTGTCTTQGNATFNGTSFRLVNKSTNAVYYGGSSKAVNAAVDTKTLSNGACSVTFENLPYGTYNVEEVAAGNGYVRSTVVRTVTIPTNNEVNLSTSFANDVILGKVTISKTDTETGTCTTQGNATFDGTKFQIRNKSTNAIYYGTGMVPTGDSVIDTKALANGACSVTFENLPYGTYDIEEVEVGNGYTRNTIVKTVTIPTNSQIDISTSYANAPILGSIKVNKVDKQTGTCERTWDFTFDDVTIQITNNSKNPVYYDRGDGGGRKPYAKGQVIDTKTLTNGACSMEFKDLAYGEYLIKETRTSEHYVLNTEVYTITIPKNNQIDVEMDFPNQVIRGDLKFVKIDTNNNRKLMRDTIFTISSLNTKNFQIRESHIVVTNQDGVVDTSSSFALHSFNTNGYDVLYSGADPIQFSGYGTWFGIDTSGKNIPVHDDVGALPYGTYIIQELRCGTNFFCNNIINETATVTINTHNQVVDLGEWENDCPKFELITTATDNTDGDHFIEVNPMVTIKDTVDYCLKANVDFVLKGILMDKDTGQPLIINGQTVEAETPLRSSTDCGTIDMFFTFDASQLGGKRIVVFETLWFTNGFSTFIMAQHDDINDIEQSVDIVSVGTYAVNSATGEKILPFDEDVEIKDIVRYCLRPQTKYTIRGILMDKSTGNGLLDENGNLVEAKTVFTTGNESCSEVEMYFNFNTTGLKGKTLVVFESLYDENDNLILEHNDINNADETVEVETDEPPVPDTGFFTGKNQSGSETFGIVVIATGAAFVTIFATHLVKRKKSRHVDFTKK